MYQGTISDATEAVQALASAIRLDQNLEQITLRMEDGFTDESGVMALAEALTVNKTLSMITLSATVYERNVHNKAALGAFTYEALSAMLRVNTSLVLKLPPFESSGGDERPHYSRKEMRIEQRLNEVGRGRVMASRQMTREEWVYALHGLNSNNNKPSAFQVSCLYSLLRLNPSIVRMA
jgi:hypothetical protein